MKEVKLLAIDYLGGGQEKISQQTAKRTFQVLETLLNADRLCILKIGIDMDVLAVKNPSASQMNSTKTLHQCRQVHV
jgi:hypothetical protein